MRNIAEIIVILAELRGDQCHHAILWKQRKLAHRLASGMVSKSGADR